MVLQERHEGETSKGGISTIPENVEVENSMRQPQIGNRSKRILLLMANFDAAASFSANKYSAPRLCIWLIHHRTYTVIQYTVRHSSKLNTTHTMLQFILSAVSNAVLNYWCRD